MPAVSQSKLPGHNGIALCSKVQQTEMLLNYACINRIVHVVDKFIENTGIP